MKKIFITFLLFCLYVAQAAHGAMIIQQFTSGGGAVSCEGGTTDYIGDPTAGSSSRTMATNNRVYVLSISPTCGSGCTSGDFATAYLHHASLTDNNARVCIYNDSATGGAPDVNDTLVGCTSVINSTVVEMASSALTGSASCSGDYWLAVVSDGADTGWAAYADTTTGTGYYGTITNFMTTPAANLSGSWTSYTRTWRAYVTIE